MYSYIKKSLVILITLGLISMSSFSYADNMKEFGNYVVHYNAFRSDTLSADVAKQYDLPRSSNHVLINIAVLKKVLHTTGEPVAAKIEGSASNMTGQYKSLKFKLIKEGTAIYYLANTEISNGEHLKFDIKITPAGEKNPVRIRFEKRFFTN